MTNFNFINIWNKSVEANSDRPIEPRDRLFASELGGSLIDTYLKLKGTAPTNPPNFRSYRKFNAGHLTEWIVGRVLKHAGILIDSQQSYKHKYDNLLEVSGRLDFVMGGRPDYEKAIADISHMEFPEFILNAMKDTVGNLKETYGNQELKKVVLEVKSTSSMMLDKYIRTNKPNDNHSLQAFHYLKASEYDEAHIIYISRDDLMCVEFVINKESDLEGKYKSFIETISKYYYDNETPPKEQEILFNEDELRFSTNWRVEYSNFLTMLYGYERPDLYRQVWDKKVASFNRTFKRVINGDKMTKLNLETIEEAKKVFSDWDRYVEIGIANKALLPQEEEEAL